MGIRHPAARRAPSRFVRGGYVVAVLLVAAILCSPARACAAAPAPVAPAAEPIDPPVAAVAHEIELPVDAADAVGAAEPAPSDGGAEASDVAAAATGTSASTDDDLELELELDERPTSFPDPFESINRSTLTFNQTLDRWVVDPVADAYGAALPDLAKKSVRDFLANLESPAILINDLLQGEMANAAVTFGRFAINTMIGCAGFFDPATSLGLAGHSSDFGQTLARTGVGSGPYLIVPVLGPTTVRDGLGSIVDVALQPTIYLLGPAPLIVASVQEGTAGFTLREQHGADLERLEQASLDYYAALRSAYYQDRMAKLAAEPESAPASDAAAADRGTLAAGEAIATAVAVAPPT